MSRRQPVAVRGDRREALERIGVPVIAVVAGAALLFVLVGGTAGSGPAWTAAVAGVIAVALLLAARGRGQSRDAGERTSLDWLVVPLPALLVLYLSFSGGGFSPGTKGFVAFLLALVLVARIALAPSPFAGLTRTGAIATAALLALALWALASGLWSDSWGRAFAECGQTLVYAITVAVFTSTPRSTERLRWMVRGVAAAAAGVCVCGLVTRLAPDVWPIAANLAPDRLSYPLTYWNALGVLAALAAILCLGITASTREHPVAAAVAAAGVPVAATALLLTFSRGAIAAAAFGLVAFVILGRSRGVLGALVAVLPTTAVAVTAAYEANLLATVNPTTDAAMAQGHHVAAVLAACATAAAALRLLFLPLDRRLARLPLSQRVSRPARVTAALAAAALALVAALAAGVPHQVARQYDRFVETDTVKQTGDLRARLTDPGNNHRIDQWRIARRAFASDRLTGQGAGTYQLSWARQRPDSSTVVDAHSLYFETAGELGVVGLLLLLAVIGSLLFRTARRARGPSRSLYGVIFAAGLAWAVHAGVDWDWEMPAVTLPIFALGGAAVARSGRRSPRAAPTAGWRAAAVLAALVLTVVPLLLALSQHDLEEARRGAANERCGPAIESARASVRILPLRPEPYQVIAYCELARGRGDAAVRSIRKAVQRDPQFWRYRYDEALIQAASGGDPRRAARAALERDPRELRVQKLVGGLAAAPRSEWRRGGRRAIKLEAR